METTQNITKAKITWLAVFALDNIVPFQRGMQPAGFDAKCSCGWESRSGGAIKASVKRDIDFHKFDAHTEY